MVNPYELPELQKAYFASSAYAQLDVSGDDLITWPNRIYAEQFRRDTELLHESLT